VYHYLIQRDCDVSVLRFFAVFVTTQKMGTKVLEEPPASFFRAGKVTSTLRMEAAGSSEMWVPTCCIARCYISADCNLKVYICLLSIISCIPLLILV
jgi:hypothetical protein